jgi:RNA polymerase sigma factor (sigma-70 family)
MVLSEIKSDRFIDYIDDEQIRKFSKEELSDYFIRIRNGDKKAQDDFVMAHMGLVYKIAQSLHRSRGGSIEDMVQEGVAGMLRAVKKFDPSLGYKFSTYASGWIFQHIAVSLNSDSLLKLSVDDRIDGKKLYIYALESLRFKLGRDPDENEIASFLEIPIDRVKRIKLLLDLRIEGGHWLRELPDISDTEDEVLKLQQRDYLTRILKTLDEREQRILKMRMGLDGYTEMTLQEVGELMGLTRERIRQLEAKALSKLRTDTNLQIISQML